MSGYMQGIYFKDILVNFSDCFVKIDFAVCPQSVAVYQNVSIAGVPWGR